MSIDLQKFCREWYGTGPNFSAPFVRAGWRYATDSAIIVRVQTNETDSPSIGMDGDVSKIFAPIRGELAPWPTDGAVYGTQTCTACDDDDPDAPLTADCRTCNGEGVIACIDRHVGEHLIAGKYDGVIRELPNVRYETGVPRRRPLPFVFDGGDGLVMGINAAMARKNMWESGKQVRP